MFNRRIKNALLDCKGELGTLLGVFANLESVFISLRVDRAG